MIGFLEGRLKQKHPDHIIVDVGGVGYSVQVPLSTFYELPEPGQVAALYIHTYVREDTLQLYGFKTLAEKEMFLHLITVNGIGPRLAVNILSRLNADALREVIFTQDHHRLRNIPGVGKKIAERIVLELRDRLGGSKGEVPVPDSLGKASSEKFADALSALLNLGYRPSEAQKSLHEVQKHLEPEAPLEKLLKEALRMLA